MSCGALPDGSNFNSCVDHVREAKAAKLSVPGD